ncbi:MAG TPA: hypothetical protein PLC48_03175 [Ferruginibacter sp.]|nr:hypothetical protein [Ferruginibacter sp.]
MYSKINILALFLILVMGMTTQSQPARLFSKDVLKEKREKIYRNLVQQSIIGNLSRPLTDSTSEDWEGAFSAMELIQYHSAWADQQIVLAFESAVNMPVSFQAALLELAYANYPGKFNKPVTNLFRQTSNESIALLSAIYLLNKISSTTEVNVITTQVINRFSPGNEHTLFYPFLESLKNYGQPLTSEMIESFLQKDYLPGEVLMISLQRKNRDYPGVVLVRDSSGLFMKDSTGNIFNVPQLARSISNLPGYVRNGNTPEGIFRMDGFDVSKSSFIGPTTNVQLTMPFEFSAKHFFQSDLITDSTWDLEAYKNLLPLPCRDHFSLYETFYAGKAGRNEIIAHGSTVNPAWYTSTPYYPITPGLGCLSTKETWNEKTGERMESDQQALVDMIQAAGGPKGYAIVVNLDDAQRPVTMEDILPFLKRAHQNQ